MRCFNAVTASSYSCSKGATGRPPDGQKRISQSSGRGSWGRGLVAKREAHLLPLRVVVVRLRQPTSLLVRLQRFLVLAQCLQSCSPGVAKMGHASEKAQAQKAGTGAQPACSKASKTLGPRRHHGHHRLCVRERVDVAA